MHNSGGAVLYSHEELRLATDNFTTVLGDGAYGTVYQGQLENGQMVAVKKLKDPHRDEVRESFVEEVNIFTRLSHKNLVALYGSTDPGAEELSLVYELVPNGTVADHLHGSRRSSSLTWAVRLKIATETAEGLEYLHDAKPPIIHRDVKTMNILLDNNFQVKVADLGISRIMELGATSVATTPQGTVGYRDPEYEYLYMVTPKSDVYSFGVVLLELISGRPALDDREELPVEESFLYQRVTYKKVEDFVDTSLGYNSNREITGMINSVFKLAVKCLEPKAEKRPCMHFVAKILKALPNSEEIVIVPYGPWGNDGGIPFLLKNISLRRIRIASSPQSIMYIQLQYERNGSLEWSRRWGGALALTSPVEIVLERGEYMESVEGHTGTPDFLSWLWFFKVVRSLTFRSNIRMYGPYGKNYGTPFSVPCIGEIVGFHGGGFLVLESISFYVQTTRLQITDVGRYLAATAGSS